MKIIFLDFDGVLNSNEWVKNNLRLISGESRFMRNNLDRAAVARLEKISQATGANVVISSTWRLMNTIDRLKNILKDHGFTGNVIDITPRLDSARGDEIAAWLSSNEPVESFVILDDDSDMAHLMYKLVQTTWSHGLQDEHVEAAIAVLSC